MATKQVNANGADKADAEYEDMLKTQASEASVGARVENVTVTSTASGPATIVEPKYSMPIEEALKSDKPEARQAVTENCMFRNRVTKPERMKKWYQVEYFVNNKSNKTRELRVHSVLANDEIDALAVANKELNISDGPHGRKVTLLPQVA